MNSNTISRNEFMKLAGTSVLAACAGSIVFGGCSAVATAPLAPTDSYRREADLVIVSLSALPDLQSVGGAVRLELGNGSRERLLVVHSAEQIYTTYANRCTHNGKELDYRHDQHRVQCISGKSHFNLAGKITKGPAGGPLKIYPNQLDGDELWISLA
ncbi:Rieske (2Fe-2S) protein [Candidatus Neomarinimicrobiota bacterium]